MLRVSRKEKRSNEQNLEDTGESTQLLKNIFLNKIGCGDFDIT